MLKCWTHSVFRSQLVRLAAPAAQTSPMPNVAWSSPKWCGYQMGGGGGGVGTPKTCGARGHGHMSVCSRATLAHLFRAGWGCNCCTTSVMGGGGHDVRFSNDEHDPDLMPH